MTTLKRVSPMVLAMVALALLLFVAIVATAQTSTNNTLLASLHTVKPAKSIEVLLHTGYIDGQVFHDTDGDCAPAIEGVDAETGLKSWYVRAEGDKTYYGKTDCHGNFSMMVDPGEYTVSLMPSGTAYELCACSPNSFTVTVEPGVDAAQVTFPVAAGSPTTE